jgi:hypothetical protein
VRAGLEITTQAAPRARARTLADVDAVYSGGGTVLPGGGSGGVPDGGVNPGAIGGVPGALKPGGGELLPGAVNPGGVGALPGAVKPGGVGALPGGVKPGGVVGAPGAVAGGVWGAVPPCGGSASVLRLSKRAPIREAVAIGFIVHLLSPNSLANHAGTGTPPGTANACRRSPARRVRRRIAGLRRPAPVTLLPQFIAALGSRSAVADHERTA